MLARPGDSLHSDPEPTEVVTRNPEPAQGIAPLPMQILRARNLSMGAKLLYADLLHYGWRSGRVFPGFAQLAQDLDMSEHTIHNWMQELMRARLVISERARHGRATRYLIADLRIARLELPS